MKKVILRTENLLVATPLILFLTGRILYGNTTMDIHIHDTYLVIDIATIFIGIFVCMFSLWFLHFILRAIRKWVPFYCKGHICVTLILYLLLFFIPPDFVQSFPLFKPKQFYDFSSWESYNSFSNVGKWMAACFLTFLLLQAGFIVYFLIKVFKKAQ